MWRAFLILLLPMLARGQFNDLNDPGFVAGLRGPTPCPDHTVYMVKQDFEMPTTGYDNCETWNAAGTGTITPNYQTIALVGTQSLFINISAQNGRTTNNFTASDEVYVYFQCRVLRFNDGGDDTYLLALNHAAGTVILSLHNSTHAWQACGNTCASTVSTASTGVTYHVWFHYKKGTGSDQVQDVGFSTDGTRPTSGNNFAQISNGTRTAQISTMDFPGFPASFNANYSVVYDKVRVSTSVIGSNPP